MTCRKCGTTTPKRVCRECERMDRAEERANARDVDEQADDGRDFVDYDACRAIVPSSGKQCTATVSGETAICGTHENARNLTRVDDVPGAPVADLRDALVDVGLHGTHAYRFASKFDDVAELWHAVVGLEPVEIGSKTYDADGLATHAETIAKLDVVDAENHPLAEDQCIALTGSGSRCTSGSYGSKLLCGMHQNAKNPKTIYDPGERGPAPRALAIDDDEPPIYFVEDRGDDVIVIDSSDWVVKRVDGELDPARQYDDHSPYTKGSVKPLASDDQDMSEAETTDEQVDEIDSIREIDEDDTIRVTLENGDEIVGDVHKRDIIDGELVIRFDSEDRDVLSVVLHADGELDLMEEAGVDHDGEPVYVHAGDVSTVEIVDLVDEYDAYSGENESIDPFAHDKRKNELEDVGLSGREAEVVAAKEQGFTHVKIAEYLDLPQSTVDEYSRRARRKVLDARALVDEIGGTYE